MMDKNVIYVYRKNEISHLREHIGTITREKECYKFSYSDIYRNSEHFSPIFPFLEKNLEYTNVNLFPVFASRLPDSKRIDIKDILSKYNMTEYDQFDLLRESQGRLPIDTLEFVSQLSEEDADGFTFFVAGTRHYLACKKKEDHISLKKGDLLKLVHDRNNSFDKYAVKILFDNNTIGFVPKYYSKTYAELILNGCDLSAEVISIKECTCEDSSSEECTDCISIKISVKVNKD